MKPPTRRPTIAGFWYFYARRCSAAQRDFFFYAMARLARDYPDADPRDVLVTHFSNWIYRYEKHVEALNDSRLPAYLSRPEVGPDSRTPETPNVDELTYDDLLDIIEGD